MHNFPFHFLFQHCGLCGCVISLEQPAIFGFGPFSIEACSIYNLHLITLHIAELRFTPPLQPPSIKRTRGVLAATHIHFSVSQIAAHSTVREWLISGAEYWHSFLLHSARGTHSVSVAPRCCGISEQLSQTVRRYCTTQALEEARSFCIMRCIKGCVQIKTGWARDKVT